MLSITADVRHKLFTISAKELTTLISLAPESIGLDAQLTTGQIHNARQAADLEQPCFYEWRRFTKNLHSRRV
jgi:hypothetical protein